MLKDVNLLSKEECLDIPSLAGKDVLVVKGEAGRIPGLKGHIWENIDGV